MSERSPWARKQRAELGWRPRRADRAPHPKGGQTSSTCKPHVVRECNTQLRKTDKVLTNHLSGTEPVSKTQKELLQLSSKKTKPITKDKRPEQIFLQGLQMDELSGKRCTSLGVTGEWGGAQRGTSPRPLGQPCVGRGQGTLAARQNSAAAAENTRRRLEKLSIELPCGPTIVLRWTHGGTEDRCPGKETHRTCSQNTAAARTPVGQQLHGLWETHMEEWPSAVGDSGALQCCRVMGLEDIRLKEARDILDHMLYVSMHMKCPEQQMRRRQARLLAGTEREGSGDSNRASSWC